ncbi:MAG: AAA family ATPase [Allosphingosinicella sp.]
MLTALKSVHLENFRGFKDHSVALTPTTVLVGQNNAGKSTFIDALRILAIAARRATSARYAQPPDWLGNRLATGFGYKISFETIDFDFSNVQYNHNRSDPALLELKYTNLVTVRVWLGTSAQENFCQVITPDGLAAASASAQASLDITGIYVMPPIQSLIAHEKRISKSRIEEFMFGRLASRHFRNQLYEKTPAYRSWRSLLQETWPTVAVSAFDAGVGDSGEEYSLILREGPFASEAAWVGGGLQAWMQILWFLCRTPTDGIAVLDEPDVFLHADMQRKLIKLLGGRGHRQIIVATHSSEIISDTPPETICVVRKRDPHSYRPLTKGRLQAVIDNLGSRHNIQLSKLAEARKISVFEGEDQKYLSEVAFKVSPECYDKFIRVPTFELTGVTNWHQALGAAKALAVASERAMPVHLIIDHDFRTEADIAKMQTEADKEGLVLHVLARKEIENYFVHADCLARFISSRAHATISKAAAQELIDAASEEASKAAIDAIADQWQYENRGKSASSAFKHAEEAFVSLLAVRSRAEVVSGKKIISLLSKRCRVEFGISFGPMALCKAMLGSEFDPELAKLVKELS